MIQKCTGKVGEWKYGREEGKGWAKAALGMEYVFSSRSSLYSFSFLFFFSKSGDYYMMWAKRKAKVDVCVCASDTTPSTDAENHIQCSLKAKKREKKKKTTK